MGRTNHFELFPSQAPPSLASSSSSDRAATPAPAALVPHSLPPGVAAARPAWEARHTWRFRQRRASRLHQSGGSACGYCVIRFLAIIGVLKKEKSRLSNTSARGGDVVVTSEASTSQRN